MGISAMPARRMEMMVTNLRTNAAYSSRHSSIFVPPQLEFMIDSRRKSHFIKEGEIVGHTTAKCRLQSTIFMVLVTLTVTIYQYSSNSGSFSRWQRQPQAHHNSFTTANPMVDSNRIVTK
ncbi:hypothetical protein D0Y65_041776 [Glycine soja]|uniref:Uncharacterized protein n=1 Tax=Glycine soja TaxID=3848 RepID=A0A445GX73_GLYSO|nr:hypothetical protein D0Y65_041776 [Glycine soja]